MKIPMKTAGKIARPLHFFFLLACLLAPGVFAQTKGGDEEFKPENPPEMKPITAHDTRADEAVKLFQHGVNLGDYLEAGRRWRKISISPDDIAQMKKEGFDHVRVPIGWHQYAGPAPDYALDPQIFSLADFVATNALQDKLAVMINIHHFDALDQNPTNATAEFLAIWKQVAAHYQKFPKELVFELDNEPHDHATAELMNPIYAQAIEEIRKTNPDRTLVVEPAGWGSVAQLKNLVLPPDENVIVSVHCYDPFPFTHQGASWTSGATPVTGIEFPGPPAQPLVPDPNLKLKDYQSAWIREYNTLPADQNPSGPAAFAAKLKYVRAWSDYYGRPAHLGEFGAYVRADESSRARFYAALRQAAESQKIGWCIWDWSANFRYWDQANHAPMPGMHEALFGTPK